MSGAKNYPTIDPSRRSGGQEVGGGGSGSVPNSPVKDTQKHGLPTPPSFPNGYTGPNGTPTNTPDGD